MSQQRRERQQARAREEMERLMSNVDTLWTSPGERAEEVWLLLQHGCAAIKAPMPTGYDLLCFNAEALGKAAIGISNPELLEHVQAVLKWLYTAHYNHPESMMGPPNKVARNGKVIIEPATEDLNAIQHEQGSDRQEPPLPSGHGGSSPDPDVAERGPEATGLPDQGSDVRDPEA